MDVNPFMHSVPETQAGCADLDQTPHNAASDQSLHCLHKFYSNFCKFM